MTLPEFLTPEEVANKLKVTRRWIYDLLRSGRLKGYRVGQDWRIAEPDVLTFLQCKPPAKEKPLAKEKPPAKRRGRRG